ncbi:hypothetical protein U9M48_000388 [Paspalum notatum var. saurae]|uniref:Uncharacterized protein n=1 Tax=Paspalum notatum var. saurae TaxID=547442 RepID=A0AAQ3PK64_PASNO
MGARRHDSTKKEGSLKRLAEKITNLLKKFKACHETSGAVKDIVTHLDKAMERCRRYKVDDIL